MARGPKAATLVLTKEEREALQRLVRRRGAGQAAVTRARIVLTADAEPELPNGVIASRLGVEPPERDHLATALRGASPGGTGGCTAQRSATASR